MDLEDIERILELVKQHELAEFELEREGLKLRIRKAPSGFPLAAPVQTSSLAITASSSSTPALTASAEPGSDLDEPPLELAVVKSPIVGTFYRAPEPDAAAFVEIGQSIKKDQVLCIIEAMKLMNEITSEYDGEIVSIYVENGKPVQYGERLFAIRTS
jgi:acetyl-CoA carboxylase biotin carboxyl carrier protein